MTNTLKERVLDIWLLLGQAVGRLKQRKIEDNVLHIYWAAKLVRDAEELTDMGDDSPRIPWLQKKLDVLSLDILDINTVTEANDALDSLLGVKRKVHSAVMVWERNPDLDPNSTMPVEVSGRTFLRIPEEHCKSQETIQDYITNTSFRKTYPGPTWKEIEAAGKEFKKIAEETGKAVPGLTQTLTGRLKSSKPNLAGNPPKSAYGMPDLPSGISPWPVSGRSSSSTDGGTSFTARRSPRASGSES